MTRSVNSWGFANGGILILSSLLITCNTLGEGFEEGTFCYEQWVLYVSDKSLYSTPETNIAVYVN